MYGSLHKDDMAISMGAPYLMPIIRPNMLTILMHYIVPNIFQIAKFFLEETIINQKKGVTTDCCYIYMYISYHLLLPVHDSVQVVDKKTLFQVNLSSATIKCSFKKNLLIPSCSQLCSSCL